MRRFATFTCDAIGEIAELSRQAKAKERTLPPFDIFSHSNELKRRLAAGAENFNLVGRAEKDFFYLVARSLTATRNDIGQRPLPNGNGDCFLQTELVKTHARFRVPAYKTFMGRGIYVNHQSDQLDKCFGLQLDVRLAYAKEPQGYADTSVHNLIAIDIAKAEDLGVMQGIKTGLLTTWSMGCDIEAAVCSICGNRYATHDDQICEHIRDFKGAEMICEDDSHGWKGAHIMACDLLMAPTFVELSLVGIPADHLSETVEAFGSIDSQRQASDNQKQASTFSDITNVPVYMNSFGENIKVKSKSDIKKNNDGTYTAIYVREHEATFADETAAETYIAQCESAQPREAAKMRSKMIEHKLNTKKTQNVRIELSRLGKQ